jgi:hypothetical protein
MIGKRITIEYYDHNESFKKLLPRSGSVVRELSFEDFGNGWYLIELDEPFDYKQAFDYRNRDAKPDSFKEMHITHLLIKSRWKDYDIDGNESTSVFVLLVPDASVFDNEKVQGKDFLHVCWGMVNKTTS